MNRSTIEEYVEGPNRVRRAVAGLGHEDLHARPGPGDWSIHEVVIHLQDSDAVSIDRMKRVVAEDQPSLLNYDETAYVSRLRPEEQSVADALDALTIGRRQWARVLRALPDEAFSRSGTHSVRGRITLADLVELYVQHIDGHLKFIHDKRARLGKPAE